METKKLNILFTTSHADTLGNACRLDMVKYLIDNFDATIITNQVDFVQNLFPNIDILPIYFKEIGKVPLVSDYRYWKCIAEKLNSIPSDGVFMFHDDSPATIWTKKPVFQYIHQYGTRASDKSVSIKELFNRIFIKVKHQLTIKGLRKTEINFVVSEFLIDYFQKEGLHNLELTPHAMELKKFQKPLLNENHQILSQLKNNGYFIITYTGWVTENRGFQLMMDSIKEVASCDSKIILVIAGTDAIFSQRIIDFQKDNNLESNIINYGIIDASLIPGILHYSDVCLSFLDDVPAFHVSPPQKIFEYFAAGKPVICNMIQTHSHFIENGKTGYVLNMNYKEVSRAILLLRNNPELLKIMSVNAKKEAEKYEMKSVYGSMVEKIKIRLDELQKNS